LVLPPGLLQRSAGYALVDIEGRDGAIPLVGLTRVGKKSDDHRFSQPMEGLFDRMEAALDAESAEFEAEYDPVTGYPRHMYVDGRGEVADDEWGFDISALNALDVDVDRR
jgi:hypothetical protein